MNCPKCGGKTGFILRSYITGWEERYIKWDGSIEWTNLDGLNYRESKTAICEDCNKRVNIENIKLSATEYSIK